MISEIDKDLVHLQVTQATREHQSQSLKLQSQPIRYAVPRTPVLN